MGTANQGHLCCCSKLGLQVALAVQEVRGRGASRAEGTRRFGESGIDRRKGGERESRSRGEDTAEEEITERERAKERREMGRCE
jgi:hypothetical protein